MVPEKLCIKMKEIRSLLSGSQRILTQQEKDVLHEIPIQEMGNYQTRMCHPLRDPFESDVESKQREKNMFGNPYKKSAKKLETTLDELEDEASIQNNVTNFTKRKSHSNYKFKRTLPKLFDGAISIPPVLLLWKDVKVLYENAKKLPVISYEKEYDEIHMIDITQVPGSPVSIHEPFIDIAMDVSEIESNGTSSLIHGNNIDIVQNDVFEDWYVARLRLHRAIYKWPGDHVNIDNVGKNERERKWVYDNLLLIKKRQIKK
jgi:hypothetical protein